MVKKYSLIIVLSLAWMLLLLWPYVLGILLCGTNDPRPVCHQGEALEPYWFGPDYLPTVVVRNFLYELVPIHDRLGPLKDGPYLAIIGCIPLGWLTYWIIEKRVKKLRSRRDRVE